MKKVILQIEETLRYQREVPVMIPDDMDKDALNSALDKAQTYADSVSDILNVLRVRFGIAQQDPYDDSFYSPDWSEAECNDYRFVDDNAQAAE